MKSFKIKVLLTYAFYITIVIMRNMRAQLLMFQNGVISQLDSCYCTFRGVLRQAIFSISMTLATIYATHIMHWHLFSTRTS